MELDCRTAVLDGLRRLPPDSNARLGSDTVLPLTVVNHLGDTALTRDAEIRMTASGLPDWPEIHGHRYEVEVCFEGPVVDGSVIRESDLTAAKDAVRRALDHRFLNDVMDVPTSENIARWLWGRFAAVGPVVKVRVSRGTVGLAVEYEGD